MIFRNLRNVNNTKCATYDIIFICFEDEGEKMRGKEINKPVLEICCGSFSDVKTTVLMYDLRNAMRERMPSIFSWYPIWVI